MDTEPKKRLDGKRLYLKKPDPSFELARQMFAVVDANRNHILPWLEWAEIQNTKTPEDSFKFMVGAENNWKNGTHYEYLIHSTQTDEIIGGIGVSHTDKARSHKVEIGYWLSRDFCHQGYMQEAVRLIEQEFFGIGFKRIVIRNDVENLASANTAKALGYQLEGIAVKEKWNDVLKQYRDMNQWAKVRDE